MAENEFENVFCKTVGILSHAQDKFIQTPTIQVQSS